MTRRTTIEIDEDLLERARSALGATTMRATIEEALRRAADQADLQAQRLEDAQREYLQELGARVDLDVLRSDEMWR